MTIKVNNWTITCKDSKKAREFRNGIKVAESERYALIKEKREKRKARR